MDGVASIRCETNARQERMMKARQLEAMSLDDLWALHDQLTEVLAAKVESKKLAVERQLA